jgi:hypothetical protein
MVRMLVTLAGLGVLFVTIEGFLTGRHLRKTMITGRG